MLNLAFGLKTHGSQEPSVLGLVSWSECTLSAALESGVREVSAALLFVPSGFTAHFGLPILAKASAHQHGKWLCGFQPRSLCDRKHDATAENKSSGFQRPYYRLFHPRDFFFFTGKPGGFFV